MITFWLIVLGIAADAVSLQSRISDINNIGLIDPEHIQFATIRLTQFGGFAAAVSQKYVLTALLIFIYVIVEQRSSMRYTILDTSVDRIKFVALFFFVFTIVFALILLPNRYEALHAHIQNQVEIMTFDPDHLNDILSIQESLEEHDLRWVFLKIITGYGNILTASIVGACIVLYRLFFDKVHVKYILRLIIPNYIMERINRFGEGFSIDMNIKNEIAPIRNAPNQSRRHLASVRRLNLAARLKKKWTSVY